LKACWFVYLLKNREEETSSNAMQLNTGFNPRLLGMVLIVQAASSLQPTRGRWRSRPDRQGARQRSGGGGGGGWTAQTQA
jgi:hypothetical protein